MQALGSGAENSCSIIIAIRHLLIRVSLIPGTHPFLSLIPLSFLSPHLIGEGDILFWWMKSAQDCQVVEYLEGDVLTMNKKTDRNNMTLLFFEIHLFQSFIQFVDSYLFVSLHLSLHLLFIIFFRPFLSIRSFIVVSSISLHLCFNIFSSIVLTVK